jgi:tetratricopeptide (TPR) repeat protein
VKDLAVFGVHLPAASADLITSLGYLPRDPDGDLDEALAEATTVGGRIVLVIGDSAAGKSRSAAQAVQHNETLRQRHLIVPRNDAGLARLLDSLAPMDDHVLWLDDLDKYLSRGLDVADIGRVLAEHPSTVCVATMRKDKFRALQGKLDDPAWEFLKNETTTIRVDVKATLSQTEQEDLEALTDDPALLHAVHEGIGLGEWMVAGPELMEKLAEAEPRESALAHTIIGWYRTGLQQPLPADDARTLWEQILPEPQRTKMRHLTAKGRDAAFQRAVDWVCEPVLDREGFEQSLAEETADGLAAHDYVVDRIARDPERPPVHNSLWELALKVASDIPGSSGHWPTWEAGMAAFKEGMFEHALTAMRTLAANGKRTGLVLVNTGAILTNLGRPEEAIAVYDEVLDRFGTDPDPLPRTRVAWALRNKGLVLGSLGRQSQAIAVFDDLIARYGTDPDPHLREPVATALFNQGRALADLGKTDKAIASYDDMVTRYGTDPDPDLRVNVAGALVFKGIALKMSGRAAEAVAACDEVVTRFGTDPDPALRKKVATALVFKGIFLDWLDRGQEAVAAFDDVVARYGTDPDPDLREQVAQAQVNKGIALDCLDRPHEAVAAYDEVVTRYGTDPDPELRKKVATALVKKGRALGRVDRPQEAVAAYDEVVTRYGTGPDPELRKEVATALVKKGEALGRVDRREALAAFDDVVTRYGTDPALHERVAQALVYDEVVTRYGTDPDPELREQVAQAQVNKGIALYWLDRRQEAVAAFDEVVTRYGTDPALHERVAQALVYKGIDLDQLHRPQQAVAAYDEVVNRYGTDPDPALREQVAHAQVNRGMALVRAGRREEAVAAYDKVVSRYDTDPALREQVARAQELRKLLGGLEAHPGDS